MISQTNKNDFTSEKGRPETQYGFKAFNELSLIVLEEDVIPAKPNSTAVKKKVSWLKHFF